MNKDLNRNQKFFWFSLSWALNACNMLRIEGGGLQTLLQLCLQAVAEPPEETTLFLFLPAYQQLPHPSVIHPLFRRKPLFWCSLE